MPLEPYMTTYVPVIGTNIQDAAKEMWKLQRDTKKPVVACFNGVALTCNEHDWPQSIVKQYHRALSIAAGKCHECGAKPEHWAQRP